MTKLKLIRAHRSGHLKINDRKPRLDKDKKPISGEFITVTHRLSPEAGPKFDAKGKEIRAAKPFEVHDAKFVLSKHGSILKKA